MSDKTADDNLADSLRWEGMITKLARIAQAIEYNTLMTTCHVEALERIDLRLAVLASALMPLEHRQEHGEWKKDVRKMAGRALWKLTH